ncbi:MAG: hypothetical protein IJW78_03725 [Clostridia bacterium]|nr:hypothetical protein [Clostridia bacterium]
MKCPKCGRDLPYGSTYCLFCDITVENDEIPPASEPTRVLPSVGEKPVRPKLKSEKKRQLILFYSSVGAIVLLLVVFIVVLFQSCSKDPDASSVYSFSDTSQTASVSTPESTFSLPVYNSVSSETSTSSAASSASSVTETATSSATVSKPTVLPADRYLSFSLAELKNTFGEITGRDSNEGEGSIVSFADCKYKFILSSGTPTDADRVSAVIVTSGGEIVSGARVGQTYNEIINQFETSFQFSYDEAEEIAVATTISDNKSYYIYFEKEDKNSPSVSALIKSN